MPSIFGHISAGEEIMDILELRVRDVYGSE